MCEALTEMLFNWEILLSLTESLHKYSDILNECATQATACQSTEANKWLCSQTFWFIQIFDNFEVKYLSLPESYNTNLNSPL